MVGDSVDEGEVGEKDDILSLEIAFSRNKHCHNHLIRYIDTRNSLSKDLKSSICII